MNGHPENDGPMVRALTPCGRTRREFLWEAGGGFVGTALATLLAGDGFLPRSAVASDSAPALESPLAPKAPHFPVRAKACIVLFMYGGVSQVDTFDPKLELSRYHGKPIPTLESDPVLKAAANWEYCWVRRASSPATANRGSRSRIFIPDLPHAWTTWRSFGACTPIASPMARACSK